ncbi:MAG: gliding motility lipoprotein GldH [Bacteroidia bacterium]|nr:gliding motility lipoprotein GldH [Bacteroidia bacterium]
MKNVIKLLFIALAFAGCNENRIFDAQVKISEKGWNYERVPEFKFNITDTKSYYNIFLNLRNSEDYQYENIYLLVHLRNPDGRVQTQLVNVSLADETGKSRGSGMGDVQTYQLPLLKSKAFDKQGEYTIALEQSMRDSSLKSVMDVGVMIKKGDPVF